MRESEARLRAIFDNEPECVKLLGADGSLRMMDRAGVAMIEADSFAQVAGHCLYPLVTPEHRAKFEAGRVGFGCRYRQKGEPRFAVRWR